MNRLQRFWRWWTAPAGKRFHVIPAYIMLAAALTVGVGALRHLDAHNRREQCELGRENDFAIRQALDLVSSTINRIVLTFTGNPRYVDDPRAVAITRSLDDLDAKIDALTIRECGERGIIVTPTSTTNP